MARDCVARNRRGQLETAAVGGRRQAFGIDRSGEVSRTPNAYRRHAIVYHRGVRVAILALLLAGTMVAGAKRLGDTARLAYNLRALPDLEARRTQLFGPWYAAVQQLRRGIPANASVDFVMVRPEARDIAVLAAAELQPRDVRLFDSWNAWIERRRAVLLHDARAANAVPGPLPRPAQFVVVVDPAADPPLREMRR